MTLVLDTGRRRSIPRSMRWAQWAACVAVAMGAITAARDGRVPVLHLGHMLFAAHDTRASNGGGAGLADLGDLRALAAPGLASIEVIVQRNDTLDRIFRRLQLSLTDLANLRAVTGVRAMLDRLNPGEHLHFVQRQGTLIGLERPLSLTAKLEVRRTEQGFQATVVPKPIQTQTVVARARIDSSLFEAANVAGMSDASVLALAKIFGTDIDFVLGLRAGDEFTVQYQRISQDGHYVKDGDILAARFVNQGHVYQAVRYVAPDGQARYYTPDGRSMEKAFLRAPLEFRRISSGFSLARLHPILNTIRAHKGVDFAAPMGTPVYAAGAGRIVFRGQKGGYGNLIEIDHGGGYVTVYGHLSRFATQHTGSHVEQGETIGYVGMTGLATGPHLHYEFHVNGQYVDPQKVKLSDAQPIDPALRSDFQQRTAPLLSAIAPPTTGT